MAGRGGNNNSGRAGRGAGGRGGGRGGRGNKRANNASSTTTTINSLPGEDCAVVAEETHAARKDQQQRNDRARGFIECSDSMEVMVQFWCQKLHTRRIRHGTHNSKGLHTWDFIASPLNKFDFYLTNRRYIFL